MFLRYSGNEQLARVKGLGRLRPVRAAVTAGGRGVPGEGRGKSLCVAPVLEKPVRVWGLVPFAAVTAAAAGSTVAST